MEILKEYLHNSLKLSKKNIDLVFACEEEVSEEFARYTEIAAINQIKVLNAFKKNEISTRHFSPSTGYGYGDSGREKLCSLYADIFHTEDALVSPLLMSGTHAIVTALFGLLRPGEKMLSVTGKPYDTLQNTLTGGTGSLGEYKIGYLNLPLKRDNTIDMENAIRILKIDSGIKLAYIQRSTGYDIRRALTVGEMEQAIRAIKNECKDVLVFVDNCYGEFVEALEPSEIGADIVVGSLIKNAGGGIAPTGGYIAGTTELIEKISYRFTAPGIGMEIGSYAYGYREFFQGVFMAPHTVSQALMGVTLAAKVFEKLGYQTTPAADAPRGDITQMIVFHDKDMLTAFVRGVQRASAVDGHVVPYAWDMPGYENQVIMAAGTFVDGASLELTADGPMREPYAAYLQGGLTYAHARTGILYALDEMGI
ncbi:MAG: aminotransferase class I/II-fold pyridoxal phosphate-dependent enzyme [Christensenellaceae bacterium]|jgi:cystathionine beta-lyase family protein involved in aluminum resistance